MLFDTYKMTFLPEDRDKRETLIIYDKTFRQWNFAKYILSYFTDVSQNKKEWQFTLKILFPSAKTV